MAIRTIILILLLPFYCAAQKDSSFIPKKIFFGGAKMTENSLIVRAVVYKGDTIPYATLPVVSCYVPRVFKNKRDAAKWDRLKYNVKKVYPYAILAAAKLKEYDQLLAKIPNENDRKRYMKLAEKQLKDEFGEELKKLTISQGRILIKLIDRQTGKTTYDVVKDMRGSFSAFMWQSVAAIFNSSLKDDYDPAGEDRAIEEAIRLIENGDF
ncbi:MAG: DUF4294 domain-containing protein [Bacteroidia bacterium]|jgi:hypothetical protein